MLIKDFVIKNFKGIKSATIEINTTAPGNIVTLIGLNESGKTTILEAISNFMSVDRETSRIVKTVVSQQKLVDLIPKSEQTNFTGEISVDARLELDDSDVSDLIEHIKTKFDVVIDSATLSKMISVEKLTSLKTVITRKLGVFGALDSKGLRKGHAKDSKSALKTIEKFGMLLPIL